MMETLKLISEEISEVEYITEQKDGGKKWQTLVEELRNN